MERPLDPGYAAAGPPRGPPRAATRSAGAAGCRVTAALAVLAGLVLVTGVAQLARPSPPLRPPPSRWREQISARTADVETREDSIVAADASRPPPPRDAALAGTDAALLEHACRRPGRARRRRRRCTGSRCGVHASTTRWPPRTRRRATRRSRRGRPRRGRSSTSTCSWWSTALWAAGAEAVSVNGQRLTSTLRDPRRGRRPSWSTCARSPGPTTIEAVGDPDAPCRRALRPGRRPVRYLRSAGAEPRDPGAPSSGSEELPARTGRHASGCATPTPASRGRGAL